MKIVWQFPKELYKKLGIIVNSETGERLGNYCLVGLNGRTVLELPGQGVYSVIFKGYPPFSVPVKDSTETTSEIERELAELQQELDSLAKSIDIDLKSLEQELDSLAESIDIDLKSLEQKLDEYVLSLTYQDELSRRDISVSFTNMLVKINSNITSYLNADQYPSREITAYITQVIEGVLFVGMTVLLEQTIFLESVPYVYHYVGTLLEINYASRIGKFRLANFRVANQLGQIVVAREDYESTSNYGRIPNIEIYVPSTWIGSSPGITPLYDGGSSTMPYRKKTFTPKTLNGGNIYIQSTAPSNPQNQDVWFDISQLN